MMTLQDSKTFEEVKRKEAEPEKLDPNKVKTKDISAPPFCKSIK